jgi:plasmid stabilization system protein ParE
MYQFAYSPEAIEDYEKSILWYALRSPIAANNFAKEVQDKLKIIKYNPLRFKKRYKHFQEVTLYKFPFTIVFKIEEPLQQILVVAIYHQKRNPKRKYSR